METKKDYINLIFNKARMNGLCKTQGDFALLLGMNKATISKALQGDEKYLTDNFIKRVRAWESQILKDGPQPTPAPVEDTRPDIVIPAATMDLYTSMAKSIDRLSSMLERLSPGASAYAPGVYTPKNYRTDGI